MPLALKTWLVAEDRILQIAQVHRARTKEGRDVVVKIQHQGIKDIILQVHRHVFSVAYTVETFSLTGFVNLHIPLVS